MHRKQNYFRKLGYVVFAYNLHLAQEGPYQVTLMKKIKTCLREKLVFQTHGAVFVEDKLIVQELLT